MKKIILLLPLIFCLSSCWDYSEPGEQNYVLGLGVDYEDSMFNLSVEAVKITGEPSSLTSSEGVIIKSEGKTINDALEDAVAKAGKKLYWGHTELVVLSETVAKEHLNEVCDLISRSPEIYSNINLSIVKDTSAKEILTAKTPQGGTVSTHIVNIFENEDNSNRFICCELWQLQRKFQYTLIPTIHLADYPIADGSAVIQDGTFVGYLSGDETQTFAMLETCAKNIRLPDIAIENITLSTKILNVRKSKEEINIEVALLNSSAPFDTVIPKNREILESKVSSLISEQINSLTTKSFGNPLSYKSYKIQVTLENSGLTKR